MVCGCRKPKDFVDISKYVPGIRLGVNDDEFVSDDKKNCWDRTREFLSEINDLSKHSDEAFDFNIIQRQINVNFFHIKF